MYLRDHRLPRLLPQLRAGVKRAARALPKESTAGIYLRNSQQRSLSNLHMYLPRAPSAGRVDNLLGGITSGINSRDDSKESTDRRGGIRMYLPSGRGAPPPPHL